MRHFFFVFIVWVITYLGLVWLSTLLPMEHILPSIVSAWFAWWLAGRCFHETN